MRAQKFNPGSIHVRVGLLQAKMEEAIAASEPNSLTRYANLLRRLRVYASVYMTEAEFEAYDKMPGLAYGDHRSPGQVYEDLCLREEYLLAVLKDHDVFSKGEHETGDASELDDLEEAEEEVPA